MSFIHLSTPANDLINTVTHSTSSVNESSSKKRPLFSYIFGFSSEKKAFSISTFCLSILAICPLLGCLAVLCMPKIKGLDKLLNDSDEKTLPLASRVKVSLGYMGRIIATVLGLGIIMFLIDVIYSLGCLIADKCKGQGSSQE